MVLEDYLRPLRSDEMEELTKAFFGTADKINGTQYDMIRPTILLIKYYREWTVFVKTVTRT